MNSFSEALTPAMYGAVLFHGAAMLPALRAMSFEERRDFLIELNEHGNEIPLHEILTGKELKQLSFPSWCGGAQQSGPQVIALMVFGLWVQMGEQAELCSSLCEVWPVREAVALCPIL